MNKTTLSHLTPHTNYHEPNYRVRTPPLPWIEGCSITFPVEFPFCLFPPFQQLSRSFSNPYSSYCFFFLVISNNNKITYYSLYSLMGLKLIQALINNIPLK